MRNNNFNFQTTTALPFINPNLITPAPVTKRPYFSSFNETSAHISLRPTKIPIYTSTMNSIISTTTTTTTAKPFVTTTKSRPVVRPTPITAWMQDIPSGHSSHSSHSSNYDLYNKTTITEPKNNGK